nr:glutamic acid-rich protein-like [Tanacetum cinerariifolium]
FFIIVVQTPSSGISILLAVGTPSTGSGNLYCQWELSPGRRKWSLRKLQSKTYYAWMMLKESIACLMKRFFAELARMGYEKQSTKLIFYKAFFLSQWKFLIHTILQSMSAKRTSWNEFSSAMASAVICLSTGRQFNFSKYIFESLVRNVDSSSKFYMYLRVGKGFSRVEMPLFEGMLVAGEPEEQGDAEEQEALDACAALTRRVERLEHDKVAQALEITKLKKRVKKLERANKVKVLKLRRLKKVGTSLRIELSADTTDIEDASNQGRMIDNLDRDTGVSLMNDAGIEKKAKDAQEAVEVLTTAMLITEVVATIPAASATTTAVPAATITAAPVRVAAASTRRRKGVAIRDLEEESTAIISAETKSKDKGKGIMSVAIDHVKQKAKEDSYVQRYHVIKKRPQTEAQAQRNMIMYLKNVAGFRLDYFKGMSYDNIPKRRKLNEEVKDLKHHLEIVPDEDDDVYTEATPLARKPNNFSDDYLLTTLRTMFERPNGQDQVWKSQRSVHGQAKVKSWKLLESCGVHIISLKTTQLILLVERRYPLLRFTLDQMLNAVRLRVEEQSEMSLELLSAAKQKFMLLDSAAERRLMMLVKLRLLMTSTAVETRMKK